MARYDRLNIYYVYYHYDSDEIVYVGIGYGGRAWSIDRSLHHRKFMLRRIPDVSFVKVRFSGLSLNEAKVVEVDRIKKHKPKYNIQHNYLMSKNKGKEVCEILERYNKDVDKTLVFNRTESKAHLIDPIKTHDFDDIVVVFLNDDKSFKNLLFISKEEFLEKRRKHKKGYELMTITKEMKERERVYL